MICQFRDGEWCTPVDWSGFLHQAISEEGLIVGGIVKSFSFFVSSHSPQPREDEASPHSALPLTHRTSARCWRKSRLVTKSASNTVGRDILHHHDLTDGRILSLS